MVATFAITLTHHTPEGLWSATAANTQTHQILGGLFTSAEAALAACWLTTDERISLPAIAGYQAVRELLDARLSTADADAVDDAAVYLAAQADPDDVMVITEAVG